MLTLLNLDSLPPQSNFLFCSLHMYNKTTQYFQMADVFTSKGTCNMTQYINNKLAITRMKVINNIHPFKIILKRS